MVSMTSLDKKVSAAIARVASDYNKKTKGEEGSRAYLTESDVVCNLYSELRKAVPRGYEVHTGLRPFDERKGGKNVLKYVSNRWTWKTAMRKNEGSIIDLCVLDSNPKYWKEAKGEGFWDSDGLRYWRFVSYPVEAIRAAIEVKIRVKGKISNIKKDIEKIKSIESQVSPGQFIGYMVVMDSRARNIDLERIITKVERSDAITIITNGERL